MISVEPFDTQHIPDAARLFADAYARYRRENALLPPQFSDSASIESMLAKIAQEHPGAIAFDGGRVAGYLIGYSAILGFFGHEPGVYVPIVGHSIGYPDESAQIFPALYEHMSAVWVEKGCHSQAITYFVDSHTGDNPLESLFFGLGFGLQVIDAIRPLSAADAQASDGVTIRPADVDDLDAIQDLDGTLRNHLRSAPIFLHTSPVDAPDLHEKFLREGVKTFIAWKDGVAIAGIRGVLNFGPGCDLFNVEGSLGVNFAFTDEAARRTGVATCLLNALLEWGAENGMVRCVVDFESANLLARRFWQRHFQPICHSVVRKVDDRT